MVETHQHFANRLDTLGAKHRKLARGYTTQLDKNGLIVAKPKRARRHFPVKGLLLLLFAFISFKAFMLSVNGPEAYNDRLSKLEAGTIFESFGAKVMSLDPATVALAQIMGPLMR